MLKEEVSLDQLKQVAELDIHVWLKLYGLKNEKGEPLDFKDHLFLVDIYADKSQYLCVMKAAQIGLSTLEVLKLFYDAHSQKIDIIYTLPTDNDRNTFVGGKVNRLIEQNAILQEYTKDKDSVEEKKVGNSMVYFRGTKSNTAALMIPADRVVNDEKDASDQVTVKEYENRLQHSKHKQKHVFSHPSVPGFGVDVEWQQSDQKHWFIKCPHCKKEQYLRWPADPAEACSIDIEKGEFVCIYCDGILSTEDRRKGRWIAKYKDRKYSGYWVSLLMAPWVTAKEIISKFQDPDNTLDNFFNKAIGVPFVGKGNKLVEAHIMQNLDSSLVLPDKDERIVLGLDTGLKLDYVIGGNFLFRTGCADDYDELDGFMDQWPRMIAVVDAGGDLIGSRAFQSRWKGRVFLCSTGGDKKTTDIPVWDDDEYMVSADRNKMIQLVVDEFIDCRLPLMGTNDYWYDYWLDWNNLHRIRVIDPITRQFKGFKWVRNGRDHKALATVYWRVGKMRFNGDKGSVIRPKTPGLKESPTISPTGQSDMTYNEIMKRLKAQNNRDWRILK